MATDLTTTMNNLVECACVALEAIGRATCSCGTTIGVPVVGPGQCCECDPGTGGQVVASLQRVFPADAASLEEATPKPSNCYAGPFAADIVVTVTRCFPTIDERGWYPELDVTSTFAENLNTDMSAVWNALSCCGEKLIIREAAVETDPDGGCSAFGVAVTVLVKMAQPPISDVS